MTAFRPIGDYYVSGQDEPLCEECGRSLEWSCVCEGDPDLTPVCLTCGAEIDESGFCDCEGLAPVTRISPTQVIA